MVNDFFMENSLNFIYQHAWQNIFSANNFQNNA